MEEQPTVHVGGLKRAVGPWGSYTWGYADVGADIYVALGLVIATAAGAANVAIPVRRTDLRTVGLAYTELSRCTRWREAVNLGHAGARRPGDSPQAGRYY